MIFDDMFRRRWQRSVAGVCCASLTALTLSGAGCAATSYEPAVVARGELTLSYDHRGFAIEAGRQPLSRGLLYNGLPEYVRCVPEAARHARAAQTSGRGAVTLSVLGGVIGLSGLFGLYGFYDKENLLPWLLSGIGAGIVGTTLAGVSHRYKNHANGHALDAVNYYNDAVGSLGATCGDLRYPAPAGQLPELPSPANPLSPTAPSAAPGAIVAPPLPPPPLVPVPTAP